MYTMRKPLRFLITGIAAAMLLSVAVGCADELQTEDPTVESASGAAAKGKTAKVGDKVTLKGTTYKVTKVRTAKTVGDSFTKETANGQFVIVTVSLTNRKDEPATILSDNLKLIGNNDKRYTTSDDALFSIDDALVFEEIQPDNSEKGQLVYDLPAKAVNGATLRVEDLWSDSTADINLGL